MQKIYIYLNIVIFYRLSNLKTDSLPGCRQRPPAAYKINFLNISYPDKSLKSLKSIPVCFLQY